MRCLAAAPRPPGCGSAALLCGKAMPFRGLSSSLSFFLFFSRKALPSSKNHRGLRQGDLLQISGLFRARRTHAIEGRLTVATLCQTSVPEPHARPTVVLRALHRSGPHRILVNVVNALHESGPQSFRREAEPRGGYFMHAFRKGRAFPQSRAAEPRWRCDLTRTLSS